VLYLFMTELERPWVVSHRPGGHFIAPRGAERVGDVSNVVFSSGWLVNEQNDVFIYYASSDTRMHVATTSVDKLVDYARNTPEDGLRSAASVGQRNELIAANLKILKEFL
jgi:4-O-beta-D-mannosyl-D-glucose phosphorylase